MLTVVRQWLVRKATNQTLQYGLVITVAHEEHSQKPWLYLPYQSFCSNQNENGKSGVALGKQNKSRDTDGEQDTLDTQQTSSKLLDGTQAQMKDVIKQSSSKDENVVQENQSTTRPVPTNQEYQDTKVEHSGLKTEQPKDSQLENLAGQVQKESELDVSQTEISIGTDIVSKTDLSIRELDTSTQVISEKRIYHEANQISSGQNEVTQPKVQPIELIEKPEGDEQENGLKTQPIPDKIDANSKEGLVEDVLHRYLKEESVGDKRTEVKPHEEQSVEIKALYPHVEASTQQKPASSVDIKPKTFEQLALKAGVKLNPGRGNKLSQEERIDILDRLAFRTQITWQEVVDLPNFVLPFPDKAIVFIQRNETEGLRALFGDVFIHVVDEEEKRVAIEKQAEVDKDWESNPDWEPSQHDVQQALTFQMINDFIGQSGGRLSVNPHSVTYNKIMHILQLIEDHNFKQSFYAQNPQKQAQLLNEAVEEYEIPPTVFRRLHFSDDGKLVTSTKNIGSHLDGNISKLFLPHSMEPYTKKGQQGQRDSPVGIYDTEYYKNQHSYLRGKVESAVDPRFSKLSQKSIEKSVQDDHQYGYQQMPSEATSDIQGVNETQQAYFSWQEQLEIHQEEVMSPSYIENVMFPDNIVELMDRPVYDLKTDLTRDKFGPRAKLPRSLFQFRSLLVSAKYRARIQRMVFRMNYLVPSIYRWETRMVVQCGPFPYHPENLRARLRVYAKDLQRYYGLSLKGLQFIIKLCGERYNERNGEIILSSEQYFNREDNRFYCLQQLEDMVQQAHIRYPNRQLHEINGQYYTETSEEMRARFMDNNIVKVIP